MKYLSYDYEEPYTAPDPRNFWHIYSLDNANPDVFDESTLLQIHGPNTPEMENAIIKSCEAIDQAIELALVYQAKP